MSTYVRDLHSQVYVNVFVENQSGSELTITSTLLPLTSTQSLSTIHNNVAKLRAVLLTVACDALFVTPHAARRGLHHCRAVADHVRLQSGVLRAFPSGLKLTALSTVAV